MVAAEIYKAVKDQYQMSRISEDFVSLIEDLTPYSPILMPQDAHMLTALLALNSKAASGINDLTVQWYCKYADYIIPIVTKESV